MKKFFERFLPFLFLVLCASQASAVTMRVVVYGDSLTAGYQLGVEESYSAKLMRKLKEVGYDSIEVINMGSATQTSASGAEGIGAIIDRYPDVVVVQLGNNDVWRGVSADYIKKNISAVVSALREKDIYVVVLGTHATTGGQTAYAKQVEEIFTSFDKVAGVSVYPYVLNGIVNNPALTLADGYHPNSKGMDVIVEGTYRLVDAGLRTKWHTKQIEQYQKQIDGNLPPGFAQPGVIIAPSGSAPVPENVPPPAE
ncbi:MAG: GDSL-type esterase/lipase family protein [Rickettsiales bacterium]|nr:GDSL-type esterase/lipase family protein [Rickettsiales bacterium]